MQLDKRIMMVWVISHTTFFMAIGLQFVSLIITRPNSYDRISL